MNEIPMVYWMVLSSFVSFFIGIGIGILTVGLCQAAHNPDEDGNLRINSTEKEAERLTAKKMMGL